MLKDFVKSGFSHTSAYRSQKDTLALHIRSVIDAPAYLFVVYHRWREDVGFFGGPPLSAQKSVKR